MQQDVSWPEISKVVGVSLPIDRQRTMRALDLRRQSTERRVSIPIDRQGPMQRLGGWAKVGGIPRFNPHRPPVVDATCLECAKLGGAA